MIASFLLVLSVPAQAAETDKKLGLHSDGGTWRFYPASKVDDKLPHVLLIGDSIMNGYRGAVIKSLHGRANVDCWLTPVHLKSEGLHGDLRKVAAYRRYDVIHFNIGLHGWPKGRILDTEYTGLLKAYLEVLKQSAPKARLIWCTTTQVHEQGKQQLNKEINPTIVARNTMAAQLMKQEQVSINDLYILMNDKLHLVRGDRFHWKAEGYTVMAQQVVKHIDMSLK